MLLTPRLQPPGPILVHQTRILPPLPPHLSVYPKVDAPLHHAAGIEGGGGEGGMHSGMHTAKPCGSSTDAIRILAMALAPATLQIDTPTHLTLRSEYTDVHTSRIPPCGPV